MRSLLIIDRAHTSHALQAHQKKKNHKYGTWKISFRTIPLTSIWRIYNFVVVSKIVILKDKIREESYSSRNWFSILAFVILNILTAESSSGATISRSMLLSVKVRLTNKLDLRRWALLSNTINARQERLRKLFHGFVFHCCVLRFERSSIVDVKRCNIHLASQNR